MYPGIHYGGKFERNAEKINHFSSLTLQDDIST